MAVRAALLAGMLVRPSIAAAKVGCPQGAYRVERSRNADVQALIIDLQAGTVALPGACPAVAAKGYGSPVSDEQWSGRVRARWSECAAGITVLRADVDYRCQKLRGVFRFRGGKVARFRAMRVPACGDGIVQAPEECEPLASRAERAIAA